jgi:hypothetical protein
MFSVPGDAPLPAHSIPRPTWTVRYQKACGRPAWQLKHAYRHDLCLVEKSLSDSPCRVQYHVAGVAYKERPGSDVLVAYLDSLLARANWLVMPVNGCNCDLVGANFVRVAFGARVFFSQI